MKRQPRDTTRQRVLAAAESVFAERGIEGASVAEISERAGFTRGAFYSNFASKEDVAIAVFEAVTSKQLRLIRAQIGSRRRDVDPAVSDWQSRLRDAVATVQVDRELLLLVLETQLHAVRDAAFASQYSALAQQVEEQVARAVAEFAAAEAVTCVLPPHRASRFLINEWVSAAVRESIDRSRARAVLDDLAAAASMCFASESASVETDS